MNSDSPAFLLLKQELEEQVRKQNDADKRSEEHMKNLIRFNGSTDIIALMESDLEQASEKGRKCNQ